MVLSYRFLSLDTEAASAFLLGYPLPLSPTEFAILSAIIENMPISAKEISEALKISRKSVAVHVCNINKKALDISARYLIISQSYSYTLNGCM